MEIIDDRSVQVESQDRMVMYRVLLLKPSDLPPLAWPREIFHVFNADVADVLNLARERAGGDWLPCVAVEQPVGPSRPGEGGTYRLHWISGLDPQDTDDLVTPQFTRVRELTGQSERISKL